MSNSGIAHDVLSRSIDLLQFPRIWSFIAPVFRRRLLGKTPSSITLSALPLSSADLIKVGSIKGPVRVIIPASVCLHSLITLPRAARSRAMQAIGLFLRANMPMAARGLVWRAKLGADEGGQLIYHCLIVKEASLADLQAKALAADTRLDSVHIEGFSNSPLWEVLPQSAETTKNWAGGTFLGVILIALMVVLAVEYQVRQLDDLVQAKASQVETLQNHLTTAQMKDSQTADQKRALTLQVAQFVGNSRLLAELSQVAAALPQDVWLSEISYSAGEWRLSGFAKGEVSATVYALQSLPWTKNVRLDGPVTFDSYSSQNRFDLALHNALAEAKP